MEIQQDSILIGTVEKIEQMNVFVKLENGEIGTIVNSEIAPGRIRNLREYVSPNKVIVCKVLRISNGHIDLSLRRVTSKEKQEKIKEYQEKNDIKRGFKSVLKQQYPEISEKIKQDFQDYTEFLQKIQQDPKLIEKYIPKEFQDSIKKINEKKIKEVQVKKTIKLKCLGSKGVKEIQEILGSDNENAKISYISAGNYMLVVKSQDYKKANHEMQEILQDIEKKSKKIHCEFSFQDKK